MSKSLSDKLSKNIFDKRINKLALTLDFQISSDFKNPKEYISIDFANTPTDIMILDQWSKTIQALKILIFEAKTMIANNIVWVYKFANCQVGNRTILKSILVNKNYYILIWW